MVIGLVVGLTVGLLPCDEGFTGRGVGNCKDFDECSEKARIFDILWSGWLVRILLKELAVNKIHIKTHFEVEIKSKNLVNMNKIL